MKVNSWKDMKTKYPEDRSVMAEKREREFVNDCFSLYEKNRFAKKFWTPYDDLKDKIGMNFEVIERCPEEQNPLDLLPLWNIRFDDGTETCANPEEIIPTEMIANGCKLKDI